LSSESKHRILVVNGPNLNTLGLRQPEIYGRTTLADIQASCESHGPALGLSVDFRQSNFEGEILTWLQQARGAYSGIVINPAGLGHTSIALLDALLFTELPIIEVHISNIFKRESFRHHTYVSQAARGVICGLGPHGYLLALEALAELLDEGK